MRRACAVAALASCVLPIACRRAEPIPGLQRLIEEEPTRIFRRELLGQPEVVSRWALASPDDLQEWRPARNARVHRHSTGGVLIRVPGGGRASISGEVAMEAREIDAIEVDLSPLAGGRIQLGWAGAVDARFDADRSVTVDIRRGGGFRTVTFHVGDRAGWRERIRRLWLRPSFSRLAIREIRAVRYRFDPDQVAAALEEAWQLEVGAEARIARLAAPGVPIEWTVTLGSGSRLRFACGMSPAISAAIRFRISARQPGSQPVRLFERVLRNGGEGPPGWLEELVDLAPLGSGRWTVVFETDVEEGRFDPAQGFPAWGHPEILSRSKAVPQPNILLISVDTLRADHLSIYGYSRETSPGLDRWARRSAAIFDNAIVTTPSTLFSHASMLSGRWSLSTGVGRFGKVPRETELLAERLRRAGYATRAVTGGGWLHPLYGFSRGFDVYRYWPYKRRADRELEQGVQQLTGWLRQGPGSPFFLFLHTYEVHGPYHPRQPFLEEFGGPAGSPGSVSYGATPPSQPGASGGMTAVRSRSGKNPVAVSRQELTAYYDAAIAYTDRLLTRILDLLEETGLGRRTIVVVTSDHGESLGERGLLGHGNLYDENLRAPLLVAVPGADTAGLRIPQQVSLVDLAPTLLELAGLPPSGSDGSSLVPLLEGGAPPHRSEAWSYTPIRGLSLRISNRLKYIYEPRALGPEPGREQLYQLQEDPGEEVDLAATSPEVERLRQRTRAYLRQSHRGLRMSFANPTGGTFRGTLRGDPLMPGSVVLTPEMPCPCIRRSGPGEATVELPPGGRFDLFFHAPGARHLTVTGSVDGGPPLNDTLDLAALEQTWRRVWDSAAWHDRQEAATGGLEIALWWQGGLETEDGAPEQPDPELVDRLRDLGYLR